MQPAGFWVRALALIIDGFFLFLVAFVLRLAGLPVSQGFITSIPMMVAYNFLVPMLWDGYTVGKRLMGIRIAAAGGGKPSTINFLLRSLIADGLYPITYGIPFLASVVMVVVRPDKRAIHDILAGTQVVRADLQ
jgi:uncharacterized RDD family membrane protein YckC